LVAFLLNQPALTALTSRIQPIPAPPDLTLYPLITYQGASDVEGYTLQGSEGITTERIVFDCLAGSYGSARAIALALKSILSGFTGTFSDGTRVYEVEIANVLDRWDDGSKVSCTSVHALITYAD
jgi:hypothetical protein